MSMTTPPPPERSRSDPAAGDGVEVSVAQARGAYRTGRMIWILVVSLVLAVILIGGYWAFVAGKLQNADRASGGGAHGRRVTDARVNTFETQPPSPKQAPPGEPSTTGSATGTGYPAAQGNATAPQPQ